MSIKTQDNIFKEEFYPDISEAYKDKFIKIPCEFFELLQYDDKLLLTLSSLFKHKTIHNTIVISLKDIILENNYTPVKGKNKSIELFKDSLFNLMKLDLIEFFSTKLKDIVNEQKKYEKIKKPKDPETLSDFNKLFDTITLTTKLALRFNEEHLSILTSSNFTILNYNITNTFKTICKQNEKIKMSNLVNIYILIKKHIEANKVFSNAEWNISIEYLSNYLKLSRQTVCNTIKALENNQILFVSKKNGKNYYSLSKEKKIKGTWVQK